MGIEIVLGCSNFIYRWGALKRLLWLDLIILIILDFWHYSLKLSLSTNRIRLIFFVVISTLLLYFLLAFLEVHTQLIWIELNLIDFAIRFTVEKLVFNLMYSRCGNFLLGNYIIARIENVLSLLVHVWLHIISFCCDVAVRCVLSQHLLLSLVTFFIRRIDLNHGINSYQSIIIKPRPLSLLAVIAWLNRRQGSIMSHLMTQRLLPKVFFVLFKFIRIAKLSLIACLVITKLCIIKYLKLPIIITLSYFMSLLSWELQSLFWNLRFLSLFFCILIYKSCCLLFQYGMLMLMWFLFMMIMIMTIALIMLFMTVVIMTAPLIHIFVWIQFKIRYHPHRRSSMDVNILKLLFVVKRIYLFDHLFFQYFIHFKLLLTLLNVFLDVP